MTPTISERNLATFRILSINECYFSKTGNNFRENLFNKHEKVFQNIFKKRKGRSLFY